MGELVTKTARSVVDIALVMRKVEIRLSMEQLASLGRIMSSYLANLSLWSIDEKAIFYLLYHIYETKIRKKMLCLKPDVKFSVDMPQAWAMVAMIQEMDLSRWPYESQLAQYIVSEIDKQIV